MLAQASNMLDAHPLLLGYGPMGAILIYCMAAFTWFMKKVVAAIELMGGKIESGNKEIVSKINETNHRLQGNRYALLLHTINSPNSNPFYRKMAEDELSRISEASNQREQNHQHQQGQGA